MPRNGFFKRFLVPLVLVVGVMALSSLAYHGSSGLRPGPVRDVLIGVFGPLLFLSIWFFGFVGPPLAYFQGAGFFERLIVAFVNPAIWVVRMEAKVACQFTPVEMVYFFFLPWTFGVMCVTLFEFSAAELVCRFFHKRRDESVRVLAPGVLSGLVLGLVGTYAGLIRGQEWVYMVVHHYAEHVLQ
ncbi:MAG: hypothetical protein KKB20_05410 [Proteobacteria bacterium]|nr:hypothetical protein [Pseudomonadota bacterium]